VRVGFDDWYLDMFDKFTGFKFTQALMILVTGTQLLACGGGSASGTEGPVVAAPVVNATPDLNLAYVNAFTLI
jgi:hypothetical protein